MREEVFNDVYPHYLCDYTNGETLETLRVFWGYPDRESLRCDFKNERKRRHIPSKNEMVSGLTSETKKSPKILVFDIETSFLQIASWGINKQYINKKQILHDWFMLSYAAKWLYDEEVFGSVLTPKEALKRDDKRIVQELYDLLDSADIVITYNGNSFDIPRFNTRAIINGIQPPSSYKSIDVFQTIARNFSFTSKSMDYVNYSLELERKKETEGMELWIKAVAGDPNALADMQDYNRGDVVALQEQYLVVRPWIRSHPNIGLWHDSKEPMCGFCGSENITYINNLYQTPSGLYRSFRCNNCHATGRTQEQYLSKEKRKSMTKNT